METRRETPAEPNGTPSIRLHYSRQFQHAGHAHTIDAEATLALGASSERREQVIRELETGVEQLARQIVQRGTRPTGEPQAQTTPRPTPPTSKPAEPASSRPAAVQAPAPIPVSESMPATPTASGERTISLPDFINYIKKRWNMSRQEAMELLNVRELSGLNLREALFTLRAIKEPGAASGKGSPTRQQPVIEAPRQNTRPAPGTPTTPPTNRQIPGNPSISRAPSAATSVTTAPEREPAPLTQEQKILPDFAGSARAPLPIQLGVVRDAVPHTPADYRFEEEDEEETEYELPDDDEADANTAGYKEAAERRMTRLKELRNGNAASADRLGVLNTVIGDQIDGEQMAQLLKAIAGSPNQKKLKIQQVEELISWAKEDYFAEEVSAVLESFDEGEA